MSRNSRRANTKSALRKHYQGLTRNAAVKAARTLKGKRRWRMAGASLNSTVVDEWSHPVGCACPLCDNPLVEGEILTDPETIRQSIIDNMRY